MDYMEEFYELATQYVSPTVIWLVVSFFLFKFLKDQIAKAIKLSIIVGIILAVWFNSFGLRDGIAEVFSELLYPFL